MSFLFLLFSGDVNCQFITNAYGTGGQGSDFTWGSIPNQEIVNFWIAEDCDTSPVYTCQSISNWCVKRAYLLGVCVLRVLFVCMFGWVYV